MVARGIVASLALLAFAGTAFAQDAVIRINAASQQRPSLRLTSSDYGSTVSQWETLKGETDLLYLDFDSRSSNMLDKFLSNMTELIQITIRRTDDTDPHREGRVKGCWEEFESKLKILENNKRRMAVNIRYAHHKYILGHKVVFNMHLNKTGSILKKWDYYLRDCSTCWNTHIVKRLCHRATAELNRVRNDIGFTRRAYIDLVSHSFKELKKTKKELFAAASQYVLDYESCKCQT